MGTQHQALWSVSLSNGETIYEEKGDYTTIAGEISPWQRLLRYLAQNQDLEITSLSLYARDGRRFNLPSAGNNPRFRALQDVPQPVEYRMFRQTAWSTNQAGELLEGSEDLYTVAEAKYDNGTTLQLWVDNKTLNSWSIVAE